MAKIEEIEGIGEAHAAKLRKIGITSVELLLEKGANAAGRKEVSEKSGIKDDLILRWVNHADLFRIKGVASEYAELLEVTGVDTVVELAHRNAEHLTEAMAKANEAKKIVRRLPVLSQVQNWIEQAKKLPRVVNY